MSENTYIVCASKPWFLGAFMKVRTELPGHWLIVNSGPDLSALLESVSPRYIFFPHWSEIVPPAITERYECVCFHMTDVPYGRGGSPLQNLIAAGHHETVLTALRMVQELDAGPFYEKQLLQLEGSAEEIFLRAAPIICDMIARIVTLRPEPQPQAGDISHFKRRTPAQSHLPSAGSEKSLYDHIRMLDAPGYPHAFLEHGEWTLEFDKATLEGGGLSARVTFHRNKEST